jgi:mutator protein MutT
MTKNSNSIPHKNIGVAVILNKENKILIDRRLSGGDLGGFWEFPGGKMEENETVEDCIKREIKEELDLDIIIRKHLITLDYDYSKFTICLMVYLCDYGGGIPKPIECEEIRWVTLDELDNFTFPPANISIINALKSTRLINQF